MRFKSKAHRRTFVVVVLFLILVLVSSQLYSSFSELSFIGLFMSMGLRVVVVFSLMLK